MTHDSPTPTGLLTSTERERLVDTETDESTRNEIQERATDRLRETLIDLPWVYLTLRDTDLESVFCPDDESDRSAIRRSTQYTLALLVCGMLLNDDMIEMRLSNAIRYGALAAGEEVELDLELRRSPLPSIEQCFDRFEREELTEEMLTLFEYYLWKSPTEAKRLAAVCESPDFDTYTETEASEMATTPSFVERCPQTVVLSVSVADSPTHDDESL